MGRVFWLQSNAKYQMMPTTFSNPKPDPYIRRISGRFLGPVAALDLALNDACSVRKNLM